MANELTSNQAWIASVRLGIFLSTRPPGFRDLPDSEEVAYRAGFAAALDQVSPPLLVGPRWDEFRSTLTAEQLAAFSALTEKQEPKRG